MNLVASIYASWLISATAVVEPAVNIPPVESPNGRTVEAGKRLGGIALGDSKQKVIKRFGPADRSSDKHLFYKDGHISFVLKNDKVDAIACGFWCRPINNQFHGQTLSGIKIGATPETVEAKLGKPDRRNGDLERSKFCSYYYEAKGIRIFFRDRAVARFYIRESDK